MECHWLKTQLHVAVQRTANWKFMDRKKKNQCHVPWKTIVLPAPSQALLISLIIAWRDKEIRTGWKSDKSDNGVYYAWIKEGKGGVGIWYRNFFVWFYLEIEGMFDDSIMLNKYYVKYKYTCLNPSKQRHPYISIVDIC